MSVNPYRPLDIYTEDYVERYRGKEVFERPPHVYAVADAAYHDMNRLKRNSSIVITGMHAHPPLWAKAHALYTYQCAIVHNYARISPFRVYVVCEYSNVKLYLI